MEMLSGGDMVVRALEDEGVEFIFGYPGGSVLHIYDALFKSSKVPHILVRHEQAATHAADGYARATGKPGVVLVTSGPGATNAITGIATAYILILYPFSIWFWTYSACYLCFWLLNLYG